MTSHARTTILLQAQSLFARKGYDGVGVQAIAQGASISKPTLYHYFKSKRGVLEALLQEKMTPFLDALEAAPVAESLSESLVVCGEIFMAAARENPEFSRLFLSFMYAPPESEQFQAAIGYAQRQHAALQRFFLEAAAPDAALQAAFFQGMLHNYITLALHGHVQLTDEAAHRIVEQLLWGLYGRQAGAPPQTNRNG